MKAIQFKTFGNPEVLEYVDLPTPQADADSAVVQIKAASVNPSDVKNVSGHFEHTVLPRTPGRDFSGVVVDGPQAWLGAEVWGTGGDIGFTRDGTHAEFIKIPLAASVAQAHHAQPRGSLRDRRELRGRVARHGRVRTPASGRDDRRDRRGWRRRRRGGADRESAGRARDCESTVIRFPPIRPQAD